jgi:hypothetical protein
MHTQPANVSTPSFDVNADGARALRKRSLVNLSKMGHCAPTVMQTMLDAAHTDAPWLVKLTAGLPGGIGNTGGECGGLTAPLVLLGVRHAREPLWHGVPFVIYKSHDLLRGFTACHGTTQCSAIRGDDRLPLRCIGVIRRAPEQYEEVLSRDSTDAIPREARDAYARLHAHFSVTGFHCSHAVFDRLRKTIPVSQELLDGTSGFVGGTAFSGMTCSAFTAGVMALGVALGDIENSRLRVLRMVATMAVGGDALADRVNAFNRIVKLGHDLSRWFAAEYGSTRCRAITQCDFSTADGVQQYIDGRRVMRCRAIAQKVALRVQDLIEQATTSSHVGDGSVRADRP